MVLIKVRAFGKKKGGDSMPKSKRAGGSKLTAEQRNIIAGARVALAEGAPPGLIIAIIGLARKRSKAPKSTTGADS